MATAAGHALDADDFMAMGRVELDAGVSVYLHKHTETRRYLNVDAGDHAYRYVGGADADRYEQWLSPGPAIAYVTMGAMAYQCWTNLDAGYARPYEPGDRLVKGWGGTLEPGVATSVETMAETVFVRHKSDDRPDGQSCPSMSIGDVVMFGEVALSVDRVGFRAVRVAPDDLITDRSWRQVIGEPALRSTARSIVDGWSRQAVPDVTPPAPPLPELGR